MPECWGCRSTPSNHFVEGTASRQKRRLRLLCPQMRYADSAAHPLSDSHIESTSISALTPVALRGGMLTEIRPKMLWNADVSNAARSFVPSGSRNTAAVHVTSMHDMEDRIIAANMEDEIMAAKLTQEQFIRETGYRTAMTIMGNLHAQGLLTDKEYGQIEPILRQKFSPVWAGLSDVLKDKSA